MTPVTQTTFGDGSDGTEPGNCMAACIASMFDVPLDAVPNFVKSDDFVGAINDWGEPQGWRYHRISAQEFAGSDVWRRDAIATTGHVLGSGAGPRGLRHCCVYKVTSIPGLLQIVHDPHPSRAGIVGRPDVIGVFVYMHQSELIGEPVSGPR